MSIFAGIFSRNPSRQPIPSSAKDSLRQAISRRAGQDRETYDSGQLFLQKIDLGAFRGSGYRRDASGVVGAIAGEPLLTSSDAIRRDVELQRLMDDLAEGRDERLREATGSYCLVYHDPASASLTILTDRLGVRPIYYTVVGDLVVFATALRILESMPEVRKTLDLRAVTEADGLGVPLADRTPYAEVRVLKAAEMLRATAEGDHASQYWRWDDIPVSDADLGELRSDLFARFSDAVSRRVGHGERALSYLSGGLDSRVIVAALRTAVDDVHTYNFSFTGTQDQVLGAAFARAAGTHHHEFPKQPKVPLSLARRMSAALAAEGGRMGSREERVIWSGDGGSVGFGHVLVRSEIIDFMRQSRPDLAVKAFLRSTRASAPGRVVNRRLARKLTSVLEDGILAELRDIQHPDRGRAFHLFLLLNDQRRHVHTHFESIDEHQLEMQLPFYDSAFLERVISIPVEECLYHRLYTDWLQYFPPAVTAVAWQTYPGHTPCPVPSPPGLSYQWQFDRTRKDISRGRRVASARKAISVASAHPFPSAILDRSFLLWAAALTWLGTRDMRYVANTADLYHRYWRNADGKYTLE